MAETTKKQLSKIARNKIQIRENIFPDMNKSRLWDRQNTDGWLSVPRALPLMLRIMDMLAPKGKPVSQTYMDLWCRTYNDSFVIVANPRENAYYAGFTGERAGHTWASRIKTLEDLGFIETRAGVSGKHHYIIVYNPYLAIKRHYNSGNVLSEAYNSLLERAIQIGANDLNIVEKKVATKRKRKL